MTLWEQLSDIHKRATAGEEVFAEAIAIGQSLGTPGDARKIAIGVIASTLTTRYGQETMNEFARSVGVKRTTVYVYRQMMDFYGLDMLYDQLIAKRKVLTLSHFREALKTQQLSTAAEFLEKWKANTYTIEHAKIDMLTFQGKPLPARTIVNRIPVCVADAELAAGYVRIFVGDSVAKLADVIGKQLVMTIKETA